MGGLAIKFLQSNRSFIILLTAFLAVYLFLSLTLHYRYNTTDSDLAIYDQHIWFISQGDFLGFGGTFKPFNIFGDHLILHFFWVALLYKLWDSSSVLIVIQTLAIVGSAIPIYLLAREKWQDKIAALIFMASYLLFYGFQAASIFPFHGAVLSTFFVSWLLYFAFQEKWWPYFIFLPLAWFAKEDVPTMTFVLGLYLIFIKRRVKIGVITSVLSLIYFYIALFQLVPFFTQGRPYAYFVENQNSRLLNPVGLVKEMFYPLVKVRTLLTLFASFGFLPIFAPFELAIATPFIVARFTSDTIQRWLPWMHYSANQAPILGFASIFGLVNLVYLIKRFKSLKWLVKDRIKFYRGVSLVVLIMSLSAGLLYAMPLYKLLSSDFYQEPQGVGTIREALKIIPKDSRISVATQSGLLPHLSHRRKIYMYPHPAYSADPNHKEDLLDSDLISSYLLPKVDYIVLSKYAFHWRPSNTGFDEVIDYVKKQPQYNVVFEKDSTIVLKRS